jgi:hypothetical protein
MLVLGDILGECLAEFGDGEGSDRDMDVRDQVAIGFDREEVVKRWLIVEVKGFDVVVLVEFLGGNNALGSEVKGEGAWFVTEGEVARHTNEDKGDGHQWAIGIEGPADDSDEEKEDNDAGAWSEFEGLVLRRIPVEEDVAIARVEGRGFAVLVIFVHSDLFSSLYHSFRKFGWLFTKRGCPDTMTRQKNGSVAPAHGWSQPRADEPRAHDLGRRATE